MPLVVDTRTGRVRGRLDRGVTAFRGVPVRARADRRAAAARAGARPSRGRVRECGEAGAGGAADSSRFAALLGERAAAQSEDCLTLDLWTAGFDGVPRPVLVFVHGGGFAEGSAGEPCARGRRLARGGDLVVVSLQYRLGRARLLRAEPRPARPVRGARVGARRDRRVRRRPRIRSRLYGHGAGATAVACLLAMPRARGLFQRAIVSSASFDVDSARARRRAPRRVPARARDRRSGDEAKLAELPVAAILGRAGARGRLPAAGRRRDPAGGAARRGVARRQRAAVPLLVGTARDETRIHELVDPSLAALRPEDVPARLEALGHRARRGRGRSGARARARAGRERERALPPRRDRAALRRAGAAPGRRARRARRADLPVPLRARGRVRAGRHRRVSRARAAARLRNAPDRAARPLLRRRPRREARRAAHARRLDGVRAQRRAALAPARRTGRATPRRFATRRASADLNDPRVRQRVVPADRVAPAEERQRLEGDEARQAAAEDLQQRRAPSVQRRRPAFRSPACRASSRTQPRARRSTRTGARSTRRKSPLIDLSG